MINVVFLFNSVTGKVNRTNISIFFLRVVQIIGSGSSSMNYLLEMFDG